MLGQTIAHYTIQGKLGEGGMGVVYKALDTRLDRIVALKFMPHHITPDDAEEARFLQEAKAASALNHAHVCTIYGIHEFDGTKFIEMEFVEGMTLRQKLPIAALAEAVGYGVQIADALYEAHQRGIVHRDIKADNIMINSKNQIKVMDFGLAKLKGSLKITKATSTVGTLAYMAPEQIQGGEVDGRSDIFSFGVVLYEMLTGRLPFRNEHEAALMYSIINDEPDPIQKHRADLPPVLSNMILRALEKDPNERFQSMNEMLIELRRLQKQSTKVSRASLSAMPAYAPASSAQESIPGSGGIAAPKRGISPLVIAGAAVAVIGAAAAWFFLLNTPSRMELNPAMSFRAITIPYQEIGSPNLSRDGGWITFPALRKDKTWDIFMMNTNSGEPRQITADSSGYMGVAMFSPDGSQIVYDRADKGGTKPEICIVSSLGGFSKRVVDIGFAPSWRPDGQRIAYVLIAEWGSASGQPEIRSVKPNGTEDRLEFADSLLSGSVFAWSPDGRSISYSRRVGGNIGQIVIRDLASGAFSPIPTPQRAYPLAWTADDEIIFNMEVNGNANLWAVPAAGGAPVQITRGPGPDGAASISSDHKRLLYSQEQSIAHVWTGSLLDGTSRQHTFDDARLSDLHHSPDGSKVVFVEDKTAGAVSSSALVTISLNDGAKTTLLSEETNFHSPSWSPDGRWIAVGAHPDSVQHDSAKTYLIDAENPGTMRMLGSGFPQTWLDANSLLVFHGSGTYMLSLDGTPPRLYFRDSIVVTPIPGSGDVLYHHTIFSRNPGVWIAPLSGTGAAPRHLVKSLVAYEYDRTTSSLYYLTLQSEFYRMKLPEGTPERVRWAFPHLSSGSFSLSADGKQIGYLDTKRISRMMLIENLH